MKIRKNCSQYCHFAVTEIYGVQSCRRQSRLLLSQVYLGKEFWSGTVG